MGSPRRVAVVLGGASCVWEDLERALELIDAPVMIAVNDAIAHYSGHIDHAVTLHPEKLHGIFHAQHNPDEVNWLETRREAGYPMGFETWSRRDRQWVDHVRPEWAGGSSGRAGARLGYEVLDLPTVLCGIPMTETPHFDGATGTEDEHGNWNEWSIHWEYWEKARLKMLGKVKSMSGRTRQLLGEPDMEWLRQEAA